MIRRTMTMTMTTGLALSSCKLNEGKWERLLLHHVSKRMCCVFCEVPKRTNRVYKHKSSGLYCLTVAENSRTAGISIKDLNKAG